MYSNNEYNTNDLGGAPNCKLMISFVERSIPALQAPKTSIPSCKDSTKLSISFHIAPATQAPIVLEYYELMHS